MCFQLSLWCKFYITDVFLVESVLIFAYLHLYCICLFFSAIKVVIDLNANDVDVFDGVSASTELIKIKRVEAPQELVRWVVLPIFLLKSLYVAT